MFDVILSPIAFLLFFASFLLIAKAGEWVLTHFVFRRHRRPKDDVTDSHAEKPNPL